MQPSRLRQHREPDPDVPAPAEGVSPKAPRLRIVSSGNGATPDGEPGLALDDAITDDMLIAALVAGEPEALGALYDRHARVVFALIVRIAGDRETAEDLLQEVFFRAWQQADTFDETRGTVRNWLHGIAHNLALNELRRRQRRPRLQQRAASADPENDDLAGCIDPDQQPAADAWCAVRNAGLAAALDRLPPAQRTVLALFAAGYSQSEIAATLGEPIGTVKSRMRRALYHLREALPAVGIDAGWHRD